MPSGAANSDVSAISTLWIGTEREMNATCLIKKSRIPNRLTSARFIGLVVISGIILLLGLPPDVLDDNRRVVCISVGRTFVWMNNTSILSVELGYSAQHCIAHRLRQRPGARSSAGSGSV